MKRALLVLPALLLVTTLVCGSYGNSEVIGSATANVIVNVVANIAVGIYNPNVDAGEVREGPFSALIVFRVDANMEQLCLYVDATPLYKGNIYSLEGEVPPIPLDLSAGVLIDPILASPMDFASNIAQYSTALSPEEMYDIPLAMRTNTICFESSQDNHFSQEVIVVVTWNQDDPEKPVGEYSGKVRLWAIPVPEVP